MLARQPFEKLMIVVLLLAMLLTGNAELARAGTQPLNPLKASENPEEFSFDLGAARGSAIRAKSVLHGQELLGGAGGLTFRSNGIWRTQTKGESLYGLAVGRETLWAAATGGVVRWKRNDGSYVKCTTADALVDNWVSAVAIHWSGDKWLGTYRSVSEFIPAPGAAAVDSTSSSGGADSYVGSWSDVPGAATYVLQEDGNTCFMSPATRFSGPDPFYVVLHGLNKISSGISSRYVITNQGSYEAATYHEFIDEDERVVASFTDSIPAAADRTYDLADASDVPDGYAGYAIISCDQPITGTVFEQAPSAAPTLNPIHTADGDGNYTVDWSEVPGAHTYTLQEDDNASFTSPTTRYTGSNSQYTVTGQDLGTWYYRVKASNAGGDSDWSNVESVTVEPTEGAAYEFDDTCAQASVIPTDGTVQIHTFHQYADKDWVSFDANAGTTYLIKAQIRLESSADLIAELFGQCTGLPLESQDKSFTPGIRLELDAPASSPFYLKLLNHTASVHGPDVAYHFFVRALSDEPTPSALVLVAGRVRENDSLQPNIHHVTNTVRRLFVAHGYDDSRITYLATDSGLDGWDGLPTASSLEAAITTWAPDKIGPDRPFTL